MAVTFKAGNTKFPANDSELGTRLAEIEKLINAEKSNVVKLMEDCGLINQENIKFLTDAAALKRKHRNFKFPFMPNEGVLRQVTNYNDVFDGNDLPRFYRGNDRRVEFGGKMYVIANDWYQDNTPCPNKRQFYNWLVDNATKACNSHWNAQIAASSPAPKKPSAIDIIMASMTKIDNEIIQLDNKINMLFSNLSMMNDKLDALSANLAQLNNRVENLNNSVAQTANGINRLDKLPAHMAEFKALNGKVEQLAAQFDSFKKNGFVLTPR